jgi:ATP-dependent Clp protease protease subunit
MSGIPYVIEKDGKGNEKVYDLYSRLLKDRIIFISGEFTGQLSDIVVAQLLFLEADDKDRDIYMYINSPGGDVFAMYAIYDTMTYIKPDIVTVGFGSVASAGSFILAAGTKGKRYALPNTEIMIHELSSGYSGKAGDVRVHYRHLERLYEKMANHYSKFTGKSPETLKVDMQRDFYMSAEEAVEYGIIDSVQEKR